MKLIDLVVLRDEAALFQPLGASLESGDCLELLGPNGSGKSTLLKTLVGLHDQYKGGYECADYFYQGHKLGLDDLMNPLENLEWFMGLEGSEFEEDTVRNALTRVSMVEYADVPCSRMSQGQKRRVSMVRWMLSTRRVWILDEPFTLLDKQGIELVTDLIREKCEAGGLVVCATHLPLRIEGKRSITIKPAVAS